MTDSNNVQCGSCTHFGNDLPNEQLVQVRVNFSDSKEVVAGCDAPNNISVHLRVSALGSCDAWAPVAA